MYYDDSVQFVEAIQKDGRTFQARLKFNDGAVVTGVNKITTSSMSGSDNQNMQIGTATATSISVEMIAPSFTVTGQEFLLQMGVKIGENESTGQPIFDYTDLGFFTPDKPTKKDNVITFTAYDRMNSKMSGLYESKLEYPTDIFNVLTEIETNTGVPINDKPTGIMIDLRVEASDGDSEVVTYTNPFDGYTYKEAISIIAGRLFKFATINRAGELEFRFFTKTAICLYCDKDKIILTDSIDNELISNVDTETYQITPDNTYNGLTIADEMYTLDYINCKVDNDLTFTSGSGATGISFSCFLMNQDLLDSYYRTWNGFHYTPTAVSFKGDTRLDLGDIVTVIDNKGNSIEVPVMSIALSYDGGLTTAIGSYGSTESSEANYVSPTEKAISRVYQQLAVVENLIATKSIKVGQITTTNLLDDSETLVNENYIVE